MASHLEIPPSSTPVTSALSIFIVDHPLLYQARKVDGSSQDKPLHDVPTRKVRHRRAAVHLCRRGGKVPPSLRTGSPVTSRRRRRLSSSRPCEGLPVGGEAGGLVADCDVLITQADQNRRILHLEKDFRELRHGHGFIQTRNVPGDRPGISADEVGRDHVDQPCDSYPYRNRRGRRWHRRASRSVGGCWDSLYGYVRGKWKPLVPDGGEPCFPEAPALPQRPGPGHVVSFRKRRAHESSRQVRRPYFFSGSGWSAAFASIISFISPAIPSRVGGSVIRIAICL
jgi:hypothetical protein